MMLSKLIQRWQQRPDIRRTKLKKFAATHKINEPAPGKASPDSIAIVVPVYRHERYLRICLNSAFAQTRQPDEMVLINDASPDASLDVIHEIMAEWPASFRARVHVLSNPHNIGQSASINTAIPHTKSDLIMILNDDDALLPHAIETTMNLFMKYPGVHLSGAHAEHFSGDAEHEALSKKSWTAPGPDDIDIREREMTLNYRHGNDLNMTHTASCFTREAWRACGGYFPRKGDRVIRFSDRDFQLRVATLARVALLPRHPLSLWRNSSSVDTGINS